MSDFSLTCKPLNLNGELRVEVAALEGDRIIHVSQFNVASAHSRKAFIKDVLAADGEVSEDELRTELLAQYAWMREQADEQAEAPTTDRSDDSAALLADTPDDIKADAAALLRAPDVFTRIAADAARLGVAGERRLVKTLYVIATSRLLVKPLAAIVQGASSSGKSYVNNIVADMMPAEEVLRAHDFTEQSFYYMPTGSLAHKLVLCGERERERDPKHNDTGEMGSKAFREMVADGCLRKAVTAKDESGNFATKFIEQPGPIAYIESSTASTIHDEDATRLLFLQADESEAQTGAIMEAIRADLTGTAATEGQRDRIRQVHHAAQRMLRTDLRIIVPWADMLRLPTGKVAARRAFGHLGSFVRAVAFLRQYRKSIIETDRGPTIFADADDYAVVLDLMVPLLANVYDTLPQQSRDTLDLVEQHFGTESFSRNELAGAMGIDPGGAGRRIKPLIACGLIHQAKDRKPYVHRRTELEPDTLSELGLPAADDVAARVVVSGDPSLFSGEQAHEDANSLSEHGAARAQPNAGPRTMRTMSDGSGEVGEYRAHRALSCAEPRTSQTEPDHRLANIVRSCAGKAGGEDTRPPPEASAGDIPAGWTPDRWAEELRRRADLCERINPEIAAEHRRRAEAIEAGMGRAK